MFYLWDAVVLSPAVAFLSSWAGLLQPMSLKCPPYTMPGVPGAHPQCSRLCEWTLGRAIGQAGPTPCHGGHLPSGQRRLCDRLAVCVLCAVVWHRFLLYARFSCAIMSTNSFPDICSSSVIGISDQDVIHSIFLACNNRGSCPNWLTLV